MHHFEEYNPPLNELLSLIHPFYKKKLYVYLFQNHMYKWRLDQQIVGKVCCGTVLVWIILTCAVRCQETGILRGTETQKPGDGSFEEQGSEQWQCFVHSSWSVSPKHKQTKQVLITKIATFIFHLLLLPIIKQTKQHNTLAFIKSKNSLSTSSSVKTKKPLHTASVKVQYHSVLDLVHTLKP